MLQHNKLILEKEKQPSPAGILQDIAMKTNDLTELRNTVPAVVAEFAQQLVVQRRLGKTLEAECTVTDGQLGGLHTRVRSYADLDGYADFCAWVDFWAMEFARRAEAAVVHVSMSHSRQPTCPRFHVDNVPLRFISTLHGSGTQWLRARDVERTADNAIKQQVDPQIIQQMPSGSVGFFRGACGESASVGGIVHRSPLNEEDRVVLKIDKIR